ncbi:MAG: hypothetical protein H5U40_18485, partial [Polyangiaceae bacterium]|nr:hypothetical protein [Polyangiaceae bacterium]
SFALLDGTLYFAATGTGGDRELYRKAGEAAAERLIDLNPTGSSDPRSLLVSGARLFFVANDGSHGRELCVTDGSALGTICFDLHVGERSARIREIVSLPGGRVAFVASTPAAGVELFVAGGTEPAPSLLVDLVPGPESSNPGALYYASELERLFFAADDGEIGVELRSLPLGQLD